MQLTVCPQGAPAVHTGNEEKQSFGLPIESDKRMYGYNRLLWGDHHNVTKIKRGCTDRQFCGFV